ncbi:uncharacterized protein CDAR_14871 [Caerostris darwini]|uniref:Uncharacterized protein n=1 Tax=Caerostris darwini TaxID=1538125 RepID=A0AAV4W9S3_9ARAC|nr:uncharacterized protein CDAR_14871 [Caerostris darwini]
MCHIINHLYRKTTKGFAAKRKRKKGRVGKKKKGEEKLVGGGGEADKAMHYSTKNTAVAIERTTFLLISFSSVATAPRPICHVSLVIWRQSITNRLSWQLAMAPPCGRKRVGRAVSLPGEGTFDIALSGWYAMTRTFAAKGNERFIAIAHKLSNHNI